MQYRHAAMNIVCMFQHASCISVHVVAGQNVFTWGCAKKNVYPIQPIRMGHVCDISWLDQLGFRWSPRISSVPPAGCGRR